MVILKLLLDVADSTDTSFDPWFRDSACGVMFTVHFVTSHHDNEGQTSERIIGSKGRLRLSKANIQPRVVLVAKRLCDLSS
jgi:hypothetical protein